MPGRPGPICLRIADALLAVAPVPAGRLRIANPLYRSFMVRETAKKENLKIEVCLESGQLPPLAGLEKIFSTDESWSMYRGENELWIVMAPPGQAEPFWIACFDRRVGQVTIYSRALQPLAGGNETVDLPLGYPLDQLLLMYFFAPRQGLLAHAAGMEYGDRAFLFTGASGAGKSTFSELLAGAKTGTILSDERMIVREIEGEMIAFGTPWAGTAGIARNGSAPLAGIFLLKHGRKNRIKKLAAAEALDRMLPLVSIPWYDPEPMMEIIAFAKRVVAAVPCYEFSFSPEPAAVDFFRNFLKSGS